jgi:hypothetical protein
MKIPSLGGSIARGLVIAKAYAVVSLGLLLAGCATPEDNALLGVALSGVAPYARTAQSAASAATMGQALTTFGSAQASAPRIQTQVYTTTVQEPGFRKELIESEARAKAKVMAESAAREHAIHKSNLSSHEKARALAENAAWTDASLHAIKEKPLAKGGAQSPGAMSGAVTISASEDSAEIYLEQNFIGNVPAKLNLPSGKHLIEVKKDGFRPYKKEILIVPNADLNLKVKLERQ